MSSLSSMFIFLALTTVGIKAWATDRAEEIRNEMWNKADKNFQVTEVPKKWMGKSAVLIAQLNRFEYRKALMIGLLRHNQYNHYRIKLNDINAVNKYSEMSFDNDHSDPRTGESVRVYAGFKVIKPDGKEMVIDLASAVKMQQERGRSSQSYYKLAIPNLEVGDILDYYECEEATLVSNGIIHFFDPVIYHLPRDYPVMDHKLQFRAERRCFINLKSLNGAPELKLAQDEANDEQYYTLEMKDIEPVEDQRWLFPYRELPSIVFRAAYASGKGMRLFNVLLGEPGVAKNSVYKKELEQMTSTMLSTVYDPGFILKYMKKKLKGVKDPIELATQAYYFYRNIYFNSSEASTVEGNSPSGISELRFTDIMQSVLAAKKIPHDVIMAVPRDISTLDNLIIEDEISWLIRVRDGSKELYLSPFNQYTVPGSISTLLENTEAYAFDGLGKRWEAKRVTIPATTSDAHRTDWSIQVQLGDFTQAKVAIKKTVTGRNKQYDQHNLLDVYDFYDEEKSKFVMDESFVNMSGSEKKKYIALKEAYLASRSKTKDEVLKALIEDSFDFKVKDPGTLKIEQTGRYHSAPAMVYSYTFEADGLLNKAGQNYLLDAGKLLESQTKIEKEELNRKNNIYFENTRSSGYKIEIEIPKGYQVQGLEKFNLKVENKLGGFTSTAKEVGNKVVIETNKHYDVLYADKDQWPLLVAFLNAASSFTEQKILLKKK